MDSAAAADADIPWGAATPRPRRWKLRKRYAAGNVVLADENYVVLAALRSHATFGDGAELNVGEAYLRRAELPATNRGAAAAAARISRRDDEPKRAREERSTDRVGSGRLRRGWDADIPTGRRAEGARALERRGQRMVSA